MVTRLAEVSQASLEQDQDLLGFRTDWMPQICWFSATGTLASFRPPYGDAVHSFATFHPMTRSPHGHESMRRAALVASLRQCRMFATVPPDDLDAMVDGCSLRNLARDETLFREGDRVEGFYILRSGAVSVYRVTPDGKEQIICVFRAPESFAEATLATFETYPANAVALEASQVIVVHRVAFRDLIRRNPDLSLHMLGSMSQHLKHLVQIIQDLKGRQVDTRLADWILRQSPAASAGCPAVVDLVMSKRVLAGQLGTSCETLSRLFARMSKKGILDVTGRRLTILDGVALRAMANGEKPGPQSGVGPGCAQI